MDVPDMRVSPLPLPTATERIDSPGALMSGFNPFDTRAGPSDVKSATSSDGSRDAATEMTP